MPNSLNIGALLTDHLGAFFNMSTTDDATVLHVAIDGSGRTDSVMCYSVVAAEVPAWQQFHREWQNFLNRYELPYIHTSDLMSFHGFYESKYGQWGTDREKKREHILLEAIEIIRRLLKVGATSLNLHEIQEKAHRQKKTTQFGYLLANIIAQTPDSHSLLIMCDDEQDVAMDFYLFVNDLKRMSHTTERRIAALCFGDDKQIAQLQAADIVAWVVRQQRQGIETPFYTPLFGDTPIENEIQITITYAASASPTAAPSSGPQ